MKIENEKKKDKIFNYNLLNIKYLQIFIYYFFI